MKKHIKVIFSLFLATALFVSCFGNVFADDSVDGSSGEAAVQAPVQATADNTDQILRDFGIKDYDISALSEEVKITLAQKILINPDLVSYSTSVNQIDEMPDIEMMVNSTDEELKQQGMTDEDIAVSRKNLEALNKLTDQELKEKYKRNDEQIKILRQALTKNPNYCQKKANGNVVS